MGQTRKGAAKGASGEARSRPRADGLGIYGQHLHLTRLCRLRQHLGRQNLEDPAACRAAHPERPLSRVLEALQYVRHHRPVGRGADQAPTEAGRVCTVGGAASEDHSMVSRGGSAALMRPAIASFSCCSLAIIASASLNASR